MTASPLVKSFECVVKVAIGHSHQVGVELWLGFRAQRTQFPHCTKNFSHFQVPPGPKPIQIHPNPRHKSRTFLRRCGFFGSLGALQSCLPMPELRGWAVFQALRDLEEGEEVPGKEFRRISIQGDGGKWENRIILLLLLLLLLEVSTSGGRSSNCLN